MAVLDCHKIPLDLKSLLGMFLFGFHSCYVRRHWSQVCRVVPWGLCSCCSSCFEFIGGCFIFSWFGNMTSYIIPFPRSLVRHCYTQLRWTARPARNAASDSRKTLGPCWRARNKPFDHRIPADAAQPRWSTQMHGSSKFEVLFFVSYLVLLVLGFPIEHVQFLCPSFGPYCGNLHFLVTSTPVFWTYFYEQRLYIK